MSLTGYQDLVAWQKAMDMVVAAYALAQRFPKTEVYGLVSQLQRSSVSVPANIAEGRSRRRTKEFLHHLDIAYGSLGETETHIHLALRLGFVSVEETTAFFALSSEVGRLLNGLLNSLTAKADDAPSEIGA
ncbi:MAG TPA: four helix bundle protein [Armatimonadota bacterium]|jgi:four helix bundle protein